jgi:zinc finger protein
MDNFKTVGERAEAVDGGDEDVGVDVIQGTLCVECGAVGDTRMLTTKIPFFREIIICSFECESCYASNNEVIFGGEIQERGSRFSLAVKNEVDLGRQLIKADTATVLIPSIEFEIPARSQRGGITTIEGVLSRAAENLQMYQAERMAQNPEQGAAVALIIAKLTMMSKGMELPFDLVVDDPAGNSFVENKLAPAVDPQLKVTHYDRSPMQDLAVGLQPSEEARAAVEGGGTIDDTNAAHGSLRGETFDGAKAMLHAYGNDVGENAAEGTETAEPEDVSSALGRREIIRMGTPCPHCGTMGETLTCMADIPHFGEVIIMAFDCSSCGYRTNEVKSGGGVPPKGQVFTLLVSSQDDLARDVLKSATADVILPDIDLEASQASLGGVYTTVEGLLSKVHSKMLESTPFMMGDSAQDDVRKSAFSEFSNKLEAYTTGNAFPFTVQLRDPLAGSFIGPRLGVPPEDDTLLTVADYERSFDEDEELGLHDIQVDDYGEARPDTNPNLAMTSERWGPDHPRPFAKGCDDGVKASGVGATEVSAELPSVEDEGEGGGGGEGGGEGGDDGDFEPSATYSGSRDGFVFKRGSRGLGYYRDSFS